MSSLVAIGCDGTNVNTGLKNDIIKRIEDAIGRPVCSIRMNYSSSFIQLC